MRSLHRGLCVVLLPLVVLVPRGAGAQQAPRSIALATELVKLLDEHKLDSVAARQSPDHFVGALYFPGTQLLVVGAKYSAPDRLNYLIAQKQYKDVYLDLNSASEQTSKIFVSDLGANGLRFKRENNQPVDTVDLDGRSVSFDGNWGRAKISEADYTKTFQTTDDRYTEMLEALIAALKKTS